MPKGTLTTGDVARHCDVTIRTVHRWIERGRLKAYQLPDRGDNRIEVRDFLSFLLRNRMPVPSELQDRSRRVLIVEDDALMASAIRRVLRRTGFETQIAADGFRAGSLLGTFSPSVMTLDLLMPGIRGLEVLKFVRSTDSLRHVRILVVSALPPRDLNEALEAGADDILDKPFRNAVLVEKVSRLAGVPAGDVAALRGEEAP